MTAPAVMPLTWTPSLAALIDLALEEDLGRGDPTTAAMGRPGDGAGVILCRRETVVCGLPLLEWIHRRANSSVRCLTVAAEGELLQPGVTLARLEGPIDEMLQIERTALNFLMRCCGVATHTHNLVRMVAGTRARVTDTRKTLPGWRALDKYAVRVGGGANHRFDLGSGILLKDNHLAACGSAGEAVRLARASAPHPLRIEVEVESLEAAREARDAGADILLLDNMSPDQVRQVVVELGQEILLEVSGGITSTNIRDYAEAGAAIISVGALTHSAMAADLSLELVA